MADARMKPCLCSRPRCLLSVSGVTLVLGAALIAVYIAKSSIISSMLAKNLSLKKESGQAWDQFIDNPVPIQIHFYPFNVTSLGNNRYNLTQLGPFTFTEFRHKRINNISDDGATINYNEKIAYVYQKPSGLLPNQTDPLDEDMTMINVPLIALNRVLMKARKKYPVMAPLIIDAVNFQLRKEPLFVTKTVREILFDGYTVEWMAEIAKITKALHINIPELLPNNSFSLLMGQNDSYSNDVNGQWTVWSGLDGHFDQVVEMKDLNGSPSMDAWTGGPNSTCNHVAGSTDGSRFPPSSVTRTSKPRAFILSVCRAFAFDYSGESSVLDIPVLQYKVPNTELESPLVNKDNYCYCTKKGDERPLCRFDGVMDVSQCPGKHGAPLGISLPHFMDASPEISQPFDGLHPDPEIHTSYLSIEPTTGIALEAARRIQINAEIFDNNQLSQLKSVPHMMFPLLWLSEEAVADQSHADQLKSKLGLLDGLQTGSLVASLLLLGVAFLTGLLYLMNHRKRSSHSSALDNETSSTTAYQRMDQ